MLYVFLLIPYISNELQLEVIVYSIMSKYLPDISVFAFSTSLAYVYRHIMYNIYSYSTHNITKVYSTEFSQ